MKNPRNRSILVACALVGAGVATSTARGGDEEAKKPPEVTKDHVVRRSTITLVGKTIEFDSTAGTLPLRTEEGKERARMFFVAYTKANENDPSTRPLTFVFNGGPGSSSIWLHLGAFGPRIVRLDAEGFAPNPPGGLEANPWSILDLSDLVFIDPPTTGYSRAAAGENASQFHGLDEDVEAVGEFVRIYVTQYRRWSSPKFLAGESYGTTRAAALSRHLQERFGMYLNGVILLSAILDFRTAETDAGNDLAYLLMYPTCAATAWYHKVLPPDLQAKPLRELLTEVEKRCVAEWNVAFMRGDALSAEERKALFTDIGRYLGLEATFVDQCNGRISLSRFQAELLRLQRRSVGRLDSRFLGIDRDSAGDSADYDASYSNIYGAYGAAFNDYVRRELGYETDLPYEILTGRVQPWNFGPARNRYVNVAPRLREAMIKNPALHVFVAEGFYDFATPYFAAEHTLDHMGLEESQRMRIQRATYEAGHMMYIQRASIAQLKLDLVRFYETALAGSAPRPR